MSHTVAAEDIQIGSTLLVFISGRNRAEPEE